MHASHHIGLPWAALWVEPALSTRLLLPFPCTTDHSNIIRNNCGPYKDPNNPQKRSKLATFRQFKAQSYNKLSNKTPAITDNIISTTTTTNNNNNTALYYNNNNTIITTIATTVEAINSEWQCGLKTIVESWTQCTEGWPESWSDGY